MSLDGQHFNTAKIQDHFDIIAPFKVMANPAIAR
jgi:hypothetical protein